MRMIIGRSLTPLNSSKSCTAFADLRWSVCTTTRAGRCRMSVEIALLPTPQGGYNGVPNTMNDEGLIDGFSYVPFDPVHLEIAVWNSDGALEPAPDTIDGVGVAVNSAA